MADLTRVSISLEASLLDLFDKLIEAKGYATRSEAIRDLIRDYLEDRRIESLVIEGIKDREVSPLTKMDFVDMKRDLMEHFKNNKKERVA